MDHSTKTSERVTAILSTIVAMAILAAGVTAQQSRSARTDELVHLESDLRFQLESAFRLNPKQGLKRVEQLEAVLVSWRQTQQTDADRRLLADWLLEATIFSMPGSIEPLPSAPQFGKSEFGQRESSENPPALQLVDASPQPSAEVSLVADSDALDQPSDFMPAVYAAPADAPAEQLLVDSTPAPEEQPFVEAITKVASFETPPITSPVEINFAEPVDINLTELTARITGYHQGLNEVEAALLVRERPQFKRLARQIHLMESLVEDLHFVRLYYESLTPVERRTIEPPRSMEATLTELHRQMDRLESEVQADFLGEFDTALAEQLTHLHDQLDAITGRVDW